MCTYILQHFSNNTKVWRPSILHLLITLLNFIERIRRLQILSGGTNFGYLLVAFHFDHNNTIQSMSRRRSHKRMTTLWSLHWCFEIRLKQLKGKTCCGHTCPARNSTCHFLNFLLTSYVACTLKSKYMLAFQRDSQTRHPFHGHTLVKKSCN